MMGVEYPPAYLAQPKNHRCRSCLLIEGPTGNLLVDCPPELRILVTSAKIYTIDAVLITHTHADHVMGMDDLRSICILTGKAMPVYTRPEYQADIRRIFPYAFKEMPLGVAVPRFDLRDVPEVLQIGGLAITTFEVSHGNMPVTGIRVKNFAYITDVSDIPSSVMPLLEDLDVLVLDAVRREPHPNHFHLERALQVAEKIGAKKTYLTHLSHDYDHDVTNAELPHGVQLAFDGLRIPL